MLKKRLGVVCGLVLVGTWAVAMGLRAAEKAADEDAGKAPAKSEVARRCHHGMDLNKALKEAAKDTKDTSKGGDKDIDLVLDAVPAVVAQAVRQDQPAPPVNQLSVKYRILLNRQGYVTFVPDTWAFQSGDQFRLYFESNAPATIQILNKGTSGVGKVLFPDARIQGGANQIPAYRECVIPPVGWFQFDATPGTEQLILVVTPQGQPLPPPVAALQQACRPGATIAAGEATGNVIVNVTNYHKKSVDDGKTKDVVFVEEGQSVVPAAPTAPPAPGADVGITPAPVPSGSGQPLPNMTPTTYCTTTTVEPTPLLIHTLMLNHK